MNPPEPSRYAVAGHPVAHSQSPFIHGEFARQTGEPVEYTRLECPLDGFERTVLDFAAGGAAGCNVTVPFKFDAMRLAARCSERARLAGAVNTLRFDPEGWFGDNTDGIGLVRDIEHHAGVVLQGLRLLLIGAGGAAAGVLGPLLQARPGQVACVNRGAERASALVDRHQALARLQGVELVALPIGRPGRGYDVVINASASSLAGVASPVPDDVLARGALAVDLMYGRAAQPFMRWAEDAGARPRDGLGMLVEQAAEAFFVWRGVRPQVAPVLAALRERMVARP